MAASILTHDHIEHHRPNRARIRQSKLRLDSRPPNVTPDRAQLADTIDRATTSIGHESRTAADGDTLSSNTA
jgi:hypothetical protein